MVTQPREEGARAYRVTGRVQGVGFRWWTRGKAEELDIAGTVRNLSDGSVEVQANGEEGALDRLEAALGEGPWGARVDGVERIEPDPDMPRVGFHIRL